MIQVWLLDENNFFIGESIFVEEVKEGMTTVPYLVGYVKGKLVNDEWVEGATEEEIKIWQQSQCKQELTTDQMLTQLIINQL